MIWNNLPLKHNSILHSVFRTKNVDRAFRFFRNFITLKNQVRRKSSKIAIKLSFFLSQVFSRYQSQLLWTCDILHGEENKKNMFALANGFARRFSRKTSGTSFASSAPWTAGILSCNNIHAPRNLTTAVASFLSLLRAKYIQCGWIGSPWSLHLGQLTLLLYNRCAIRALVWILPFSTCFPYNENLKGVALRWWMGSSHSVSFKIFVSYSSLLMLCSVLRKSSASEIWSIHGEVLEKSGKIEPRGYVASPNCWY